MTPLKYVVNLVDMWINNSVCVMWPKLDLLWLIINSYGATMLNISDACLQWHVYTSLSKKTKCTLLFGALHVHLYLPLWYVQLHSLVFSIPRLQTAGCGLLATYPGSFSLNAWERAPGMKLADCRLRTAHFAISLVMGHIVFVHLIFRFCILLKMIGKANNNSNK